MTKYKLNFENFGFMEIEATIRLLQLYMKEKNKGNNDLWLNEVVFDNEIPRIYMTDDEGKKYQETFLKIEPISKEDDY